GLLHFLVKRSRRSKAITTPLLSVKRPRRGPAAPAASACAYRRTSREEKSISRLSAPDGGTLHSDILCCPRSAGSKRDRLLSLRRAARSNLTSPFRTDNMSAASQLLTS